jgi:hypothetical protein
MLGLGRCGPARLLQFARCLVQAGRASRLRAQRRPLGRWGQAAVIWHREVFKGASSRAAGVTHGTDSDLRQIWAGHSCTSAVSWRAAGAWRDVASTCGHRARAHPRFLLCTGIPLLSTSSQPLDRPCALSSSAIDAPAVYFLLPTEENVSRIERDFQAHTYGALDFGCCA